MILLTYDITLNNQGKREGFIARLSRTGRIENSLQLPIPFAWSSFCPLSTDWVSLVFVNFIFGLLGVR